MPVAWNERLIAYYYPPKDWWVACHLGPGTEAVILAEGTIQIPNARIICQQARYETPLLIGQRQLETGPG